MFYIREHTWTHADAREGVLSRLWNLDTEHMFHSIVHVWTCANADTGHVLYSEKMYGHTCTVQNRC